jgi:hypothetical protein
MDHASIEKRIELLETAQAEYKTKKNILQDGLTNDEEYMALDDKAKDAKTRFAAHKQALMNEPENRKLTEDLKDLAQEIKDTKQLLGDELVAYFMENNTLEYTDGAGQKRRFSVSARFTRAGKDE